MALERGDDVNSPLDPTKYPPLSGPLPGEEASTTTRAHSKTAEEARNAKLKLREEMMAKKNAAAGSDVPKPKPKPKPKPGVDAKRPSR